MLRSFGLLPKDWEARYLLEASGPHTPSRLTEAAMRAWIAILLAWLGLAMPALAENRLALVIGNDDYQHIDKLQKATADAKAYASVLRDKGFSVQEGYDFSILDMSGAVADFVARIHPGDTTVFIYAGHGWSDGAHNYLVGVDVPDRVNQERLTRLSLPLRNGIDGVLDDLQRKNAGLKAAIIDACRDDPFHPTPGERGYALTRGLKPQSEEGSFIIYSAGEGQTAIDRLSEADPDPNSVFTRTLLPLLRADVPLRDAIKASQQKTHGLADSAGHDQTPAYYDEVLGEACLSAGCKTSAVPAPVASPAPDEALAAMIEGATSADWLAPMIAGLPEGSLKERAKARAEALKKTPAPTPVPEPPKPSPSPTVVSGQVVAAQDTDSVERGWLGVEVKQVTADLARRLGVKTASGALVVEEPANSPAATAGVKVDDVITAVNGNAVSNPTELARRVVSIGPNKRAELSVWRNGAQRTFDVTLGAIPTKKNQAQRP
jgi:hypothetical protein